jgi:hypothetical protein
MSGTINQRVSRVVIIIIAVSDIFIALGFLIKASFDKNQKYKYIENETEWNSLYVSLIITGVLVLYGLFRPNPRCVLISLAIKVFAMLCITYAVIRGKLENIRCERELCRFSEVCLCFERKNKFEYEYTPKWLSEYNYLNNFCDMTNDNNINVDEI